MRIRGDLHDFYKSLALEKRRSVNDTIGIALEEQAVPLGFNPEPAASGSSG